MPNSVFSLVVLISGDGSNLQAIIDSINNAKIDAVISAVISNREDAYGLVRAETAGIPTRIVSSNDYLNRTEYDSALATVIADYAPNLIVLAGFMRILGAEFVTKFAGKIINIHPSLLPKFKGLNTHQRTLQAGEKSHGATVHFVTAELDDGPIIAQAKINVEDGDTASSLQQKVLQQEHLIYSKAIQSIVAGKVNFNNAVLSTH